MTVSPISAWETLAMLHAGAHGPTAVEIAQVLGVTDDRKQVARAVRSLREEIGRSSGTNTTLDSSNRIWVERGMRLEDSFVSTLERGYSASVGRIEFASRPEESRVEINRWVSDQTNRRIAELLAPGTITPDSSLVLTNAIYFKAPWATAFEKSSELEKPFRLGDGRSVAIRFMQRSGDMGAGRIGEGASTATVCEIPYKNNHLAMILVVPDDLDGLRAVLEGMNGGWRENWGDVRERDVDLVMPRWKVSQRLQLDDMLQTMGMHKAFRRELADFSGICSTRDAFVSSVTQQCFVDVREKGTEAAAATAVDMSFPAAPPPAETLECHADHPFAWAIVIRSRGVILCAGTVVDPR